MIATYPDIAVVPILLGCLLVAVVVPVLVFPVTYTVWGAIDLAMHPLQPDEVADAAAAPCASAPDRRAGEISADGA